MNENTMNERAVVTAAQSATASGDDGEQLLRKTGPSGKTSPRRRKPDPQDHQERSEFLGHWRDRYRQTRGRDYLLRPGEANAAGRIIRDVGLEQACAATNRVLGSTDPWITKNASIALLERQLNRFIQEESDVRSHTDTTAIPRGRYAHLHQSGGPLPAQPNPVTLVGA